jgi:hypothetical protein
VITFITDIQSNEPDILEEIKMEKLRVLSLSGLSLLVIPAPTGGWSHASLVQLCQLPDEADAFLGTTWIGSTEV